MENSQVITETKWTIDKSHCEIGFKVRHLMISNVKGTFKIFDASIFTTGNDFTTAEIDFWIDVNSIDTGDKDRDAHLVGTDFFDAKIYPEINFASGTMQKADADGNYELWGKLTMKGITQNMKLNVQFGGIVNDPYGNLKAGFTVTCKLNRSDYGLVWNTTIETGGIMVGDEITILCEIALTNAGPKEPTMILES